MITALRTEGLIGHTLEVKSPQSVLDHVSATRITVSDLQGNDVDLPIRKAGPEGRVQVDLGLGAGRWHDATPDNGMLRILEEVAR